MLQNLLQKIGENKRKFSLISVAVVMLLVLPVTLFLVKKNQENRSRAAAEAKLLLSTSKLTLAQNETATIFVALDTGGNNISAIDVTLKYDPASLQFDSYTADPANLPEITHDRNIATGTFHYIGANTKAEAKILGVKVPIFTLKLKAKSAGSISISAIDAQLSAVGHGATPLRVSTPPLFATDIVGNELSCNGDSGVSVTYRMNSPIAGKTNGSISSITYVSGDWCAWAAGNADPASKGRCPLKCPRVDDAGGGREPITIAANKFSFGSNFDSIFPDNTGSCTYKVVCTAAGAPTPTPTPTSTPTPTPTPTSTPVNMCTATKNRPESCACDNDNQCRSTLCSSGKCSPRPTQAVVPGHTGLSFSVALPGIAQKLDNNDDNPKPVNSSRIARLQIYNSSNAPMLQSLGIPALDANGRPVSDPPAAGEKRSLAFNPTNYKFEGAIDLGTGFTTGSYTLKLGLDNSLKKQLGGIITITQGLVSNTSTSTLLVPGDINQDNSVDIQDYNTFIACYRNLPICTPDIRAFADLNDNGEIDTNDEAILKRGFQVRNGD